jgi:hypothetical protein
MATRKSKKRPADFGDEDAVLAEVAKDLDEDADDLTIEEDRGLGGFGEGTAYRISTPRGGREWVVVQDHDTAYKLAIAVVKQDLESEPEIFNKDFLESHIDVDRLRRDLHSDVSSSNYDRLEEMDAEDFWREAEGQGMDVPEPEVDEDGDEEELREPTSGEIDDLAERLTDAELKDPMQYLSDMYGDKEAVEQAIKIAGIDEDAAAEDAVDTDGWEHFLARYDGNSHETASGFVYWRDN